MLSNGCILFHGRQDDQVKLRGQRIELGEIEHALLAESVVSDGVCLLIEGSAQASNRLVAYWSSKPADCDSASYNNSIFEGLQSQLPAYMLPDYLIHVDLLPLTSQGKCDKKALKQLFRKTGPAALSKYTPENPSRDGDLKHPDEIKVAEAVSEVTSTPLSVIGRNTSFFALGLDSINCISLSRKLLELGFGQVDVSQILRHASVSRLLRALPGTVVDDRFHCRINEGLEHIFAESWRESVELTYDQKGFQVQKILPCTPLQEVMLSQNEGGSNGAYQNQLTFSVHGNLQKLKAAWSTCVAAHEILRTGFILTDSSEFPFAQVVLAEMPSSWDNENHFFRAENDRERFMMPPYSFTVVKRAGTSPPRLILKIHHALYDAQGLTLLFHDVERAYEDSCIQGVSSLQPYLEYMVSLDRGLADGFWQAHLTDYRPKFVSQPLRRWKTESNSNESVCYVPSRIPLQALVKASKQTCVTVLSLLQLSWVRLLALYFNDPDICFGNVYSGRNLPISGVEEISGPCFNTLPVRMTIDNSHTNQQVARRLHNHNLAALRFQPYPLRLIQRSQGMGRLFDTLLLLQVEPTELNPLIWTLEEDLGHMGFPLILEVNPQSRSDKLDLILHAELGLLSQRVAEAIVSDFDCFLEHVTQFPDALASDNSIIGHEERLLVFHPPVTASTAVAVRSSEESFLNDCSSLESYVCGVLSKVSHGDICYLTRDTTIFHLGFDSISAIRIAAELRKDGYKISTGDILEAATVPKIASLCVKPASNVLDDSASFDFDAFHRKHVAEICRRYSINHQTVEEIRPCTPFQSGILAKFIRSEGGYYLNSVDYKLESDIDLRILRIAWQAVSLRHDILRTGFVEVDDVQCPFAMVVYVQEACELPWSDDVPLDQDHTEYAKSVMESLHHPPWRLCLRNQGIRKIMQFSMLHALFDATTLELLLDDVAAAYRGEKLPDVVPIKPCLSRILHKSSLQPADETYTLNPDMAPSSKFPNLHSHNQEGAGFYTIEHDCCHSLSHLQSSCREAGVTLQVASQCAWARLLLAYTGATATTFGVVLTGRSERNGEEQVLFPCISTIPVSVKAEGITNRALLEGLARSNATLMKNTFASFRGQSTPQEELFDSLFVFQNQRQASRLAPWEMLAEDARANYTVSVELLTNHHDKLHFRLTFQKQTIPVEQGRLIVRQLSAILQDTLNHLDGEASAVIHIDSDLVSVAHPKDLLIETEIQHLHQFVEINSQDSPRKTAFEFAVSIVRKEAVTISWTYSQLNAEGNKFAHILQQNGAVPGDMIGICFDKCPEASFAILGILKVGCAYVALDPGAPEARKRFILEDSGCRILCTTQDKAGSLALLSNVQVLRVDKLLEEKDLPCNAVTLSRKLVTEDVCYCLYTSGTTGTPKGCLITHGNAVQFVLAFQRLFAGHWDADSRFLQFASFHFDVSVMEQYWSWSIGICVTSAPRDLLFEDLAAAICALRITHIDLTPSIARLLTPEECPSLCRGAFITGGEQLTQDIINAWGNELVIYNGYGPSEVTIGCTMYPRVSKSAKPSNIGPAYDNVGAYVLGVDKKHPVIKGAIGELCVSGPLVGKGYLNRPKLTAEKFEFLDHIQVQVYHTGDLVRLLSDGSFCFISRVDDQVKLRGQRLEIGEINHVVRQASKTIKETATMVLRHGERSREQIVTFITPGESRATVNDAVIDDNPDILALVHRIRTACDTTLPAFMVPTYIIPVKFMPLSPNNKISHKSLESLFQTTSSSQLHDLSEAQAFPRNINSNETKIVISVISRVIGIPEDAILMSSRLIELGLDSISAISLARTLKRAGFDAANPSMIMRNPVVVDLVIALTELTTSLDDKGTNKQTGKRDIAAFEKTHRSAIEVLLGISDDHIEKIAPCTALQEGMIARTLNNDDVTYFSSFTFDLDTCLDISRLQKAWMQVERENEILRTRFVPTRDGYAQVVLEHGCGPLNRFQSSAIERETEYKDVLKHDFMHWSESARNLENDLWALIIYRMPQKVLMTLHIFHGLYDGISLGLVLEEVACHYNGRPGVRPKPTYHDVLPLGPLSCLPAAQDFWTKRLHTIHLLDLPLRHKANKIIVVTSNNAPSNNTRQMQLQLGVTEAAIFHACWLIALENKFGILPTTGVVVSGRALDIDGIENVVGPLFNTIPCQIDVETLPNIAELAKACHSFNVEAIPYQHTPLSKISKWLGRNSADPLFDSLFVFQKDTGSFGESRKLWTMVDTRSQPDYPLALEVEQGIGGSLTCTVVARSENLHREDLHELLEVFNKVLIDMSEDPHQPLQSHKIACSRPLDSHNNKRRLAVLVSSKQMGNNVVASTGNFQWDSTSKKIRSEIAELSGSNIHDVAPYISIFQLGLDSIDAIKLSARFKAVGISLSVSGILQAGSVAEMVKHVTVAKFLHSNSLHPRLHEVVKDLRRSLMDQGVPVQDYEKVLPVTPLQESMLANYQQYYSQDVLRLVEGVDIEKLRSAWRVAVSTHAILRTSFVEVDDPESIFTYAQLVSRNVEFECFSTTLGSEAELQLLLASQRVEVGRKGVNQVALHLNFVVIGSIKFLVVGLPHAVYDGWSIDLLHQDVARCYMGLQCVRPSYEPILENILGAVSEKSSTFWRDQLSDFRPRSFPQRQDEQAAYSTTSRHEVLSDVSVRQAATFCRAHGVTLQSLALTCWALVLARYLEGRDVCFGVVLAGRNIEEADEMMFPVMNTVPFRVVLEGTKLEMVNRVHKQIIAISEHQHFPLRKSNSWVKSFAGQLFDTLFVYQKNPAQSRQLKPLYQSSSNLSDPEYPVNVEMELLHEQFVWRTACKNGAHDEQDAQALLRQVDEVLKLIIVKPSGPAFVSLSNGSTNHDLYTFNALADEDTLYQAQKNMLKDAHADEPGFLRNRDVICQVLADIAKVGKDEITGSTNLVHLGLDSISAIKVSSALAKRSISLTVSEMLKALTVQRMAEAAKPSLATSGERLVNENKDNIPLLDQHIVRNTLERAGIEEVQVEDVLPCTSGQEFFLGMWQASGGTLFYPEFHYRIQGSSIRRDTITKAWEKLVQVVPVLRTNFLAASTSHPFGLQIVLKEASTSVIWTEETDLATREANSLSSHRDHSPVMLFARETPTAILLRLRIHHALYDGVSLPRILNVFESLCNNLTYALDLEIGFRAYLNYVQIETVKEEQKTFWTSYLNGSPSLRPLGTTSFEVNRIEVFRPRLIDNLSLIDKKLKESVISFQALFFAAYARVHSKLMARTAGTSKNIDNIVVGVYLANRSHEHRGLLDLLAPTINVVPLMIDVRQGVSLFESAGAVQEDLGKIGSIEHCTVSLSEIHEWTTAKIDCFVNFLKLPDVEKTYGTIDNEVKIEEIEAIDRPQNNIEEPKPPSPFVDAVPIHDNGVYLPSIDIEGAIRNGVLDVGVFAHTDLLDKREAENLVEELQALLRACEH